MTPKKKQKPAGRSTRSDATAKTGAGRKGREAESLDPRRLTALRLRQLAETASGWRHRELKLVFLEQGKDVPSPGYYLLDSKDPRGGKGILVNEPVGPTGQVAGPFPGKMKYVKVAYGKKKRDLVADGCDALFWSRPAMEKFVLDYYMPLKTPEEFLALYARVMGLTTNEVLYGIAHTYPSIDTELTDDTVQFHTERGPVSGSEYLRESVALYQAFMAAPSA